MKGRIARKSGGPTKGVNDFAKDLADKPERRNIAPKIFAEAEKRKTGGKVHGMDAKHHAGRKPRKSGGRTGSNMNPMSSAAKGSPAPGRDVSGSLD